ncbi:MAG TPA: hypothetical protein VIJ34_00705 [Acidimicrobiales bacterium]
MSIDRSELAPNSPATIGWMDLVELTAETFTCPRCASEVEERFYGPCSKCRDELGTTMRRAESAPVVATEYVPKMNVTPNQVATKE